MSRVRAPSPARLPPMLGESTATNRRLLSKNPMRHPPGVLPPKGRSKGCRIADGALPDGSLRVTSLPVFGELDEFLDSNSVGGPTDPRGVAPNRQRRLSTRTTRGLAARAGRTGTPSSRPATMDAERAARSRSLRTYRHTNPLLSRPTKPKVTGSNPVWRVASGPAIAGNGFAAAARPRGRSGSATSRQATYGAAARGDRTDLYSGQVPRRTSGRTHVEQS